MKIVSTIGCSTEVLEAITQTCLFTHSDSLGRNTNFIENRYSLKSIERTLKYAVQLDKSSIAATSFGTTDSTSAKLPELYRLAGLTYFYRATQGLSRDAFDVRSLVKDALSILTDIEFCNRNFPLTIIGCEAYDDHERIVILEVISRTRAHSASVDIAHQFIEASWAQDDLSPDVEIDYIQKLDAIMSKNGFPPSFA